MRFVLFVAVIILVAACNKSEDIPVFINFENGRVQNAENVSFDVSYSINRKSGTEYFIIQRHKLNAEAWSGKITDTLSADYGTFNKEIHLPDLFPGFSQFTSRDTMYFMYSLERKLDETTTLQITRTSTIYLPVQ